MPPGEAFSPSQLMELEKFVQQAQARCGLPFTLYVGPLTGGRSQAEALHAARTPDPPASVLVAVDPEGRQVQIVTGGGRARACDENACALAAVAMTASFTAGDLVGGIRNGLQLLGEHARRPPMLHTDTL